MHFLILVIVSFYVKNISCGYNIIGTYIYFDPTASNDTMIN